MKGNNKKVIISAVVILVVLAVVCLVFVPRDVYIVTTTSSFISTTEHYYITNPIFGTKLPVLMNKPDAQSYDADRTSELTEVRDFVLEHDPEAYPGSGNNNSFCFCKINGYMYYYHTNDVDHFYRMSSEGEIKQFDFAEMEENDEERIYYSKSKEVDSSFVSNRSILTEGLINNYFGLQTSINQVDGKFYSHSVYYSGGRMFFEKRCTLYEYKPGKGKFTKVATLKPNETIRYVLVK